MTLPPAMLILCLKAFGDLVIARASLRHAGDPPGVALAIASHLVELDAALGPARPPLIVAHREGGVPALFDVRKRGVRRAVGSGLALRRALARLDTPAATVRVFDKVGIRERFIAGGHPIRPLPAAANVYLAYAELLGIAPGRRPPLPGGGRRIGIFPSSRIDRKNVPLPLLRRVVDRVGAAGLVPEVFLLDGERPELAAVLTDATIVPRRFAAMLDAVRGVDAVISADSMPAHMAEYAGRPVFVLSPVDNAYWLPQSSFAAGLWARFADVEAANDVLDAFVAAVQRSAVAAASTA